MDERRMDQFLTLALLVLLGAVSLIKLVQGDLPWMAFALFAMACTVGTYLVFGRGILRLPTSVYAGVVLFLFMQFFAGELMRAFYTMPYFDKAIHLLSGTLLPFIGYRVYLRISEAEGGKLLALLFAMMFAIFLATAWELLEFTTDSLFGTTSQQESLQDTMVDLVMGSLGTLIATIALHTHLYRHPVGIFTKIEEEAKRAPMPLGDKDEEGMGK